MVSVQAGCTLDQALELMNERAAKCGKTTEDIALAVIERRIRFDSPPEP